MWYYEMEGDHLVYIPSWSHHGDGELPYAVTSGCSTWREAMATALRWVRPKPEDLEPDGDALPAFIAIVVRSSTRPDLDYLQIHVRRIPLVDPD